MSISPFSDIAILLLPLAKLAALTYPVTIALPVVIVPCVAFAYTLSTFATPLAVMLTSDAYVTKTLLLPLIIAVPAGIVRFDSRYPSPIK